MSIAEKLSKGQGGGRETIDPWETFYRKNANRFFKDRYWPIHTFAELAELALTRGEEDDKFCNSLTKSRDPSLLFSTLAKAASQAEIPSTTSLESSIPIPKRPFPAPWYNPEFNGPIILLEIGCGVGNFFYPLLARIKDLRVQAIDISPKALDLVRQHPNFNPSRISLDCIDLTKSALHQPSNQWFPNRAHLASMIFVLSAVPPARMEQVVIAIASQLDEGAVLMLRDYAFGDYASKRFEMSEKNRIKSESDSSLIEDSWFVRHDGTFSYFFKVEELRNLFEKTKLWTCIECEYYETRLKNAKTGLDIQRVYIQARFQRNKST